MRLARGRLEVLAAARPPKTLRLVLLAVINPVGGDICLSRLLDALSLKRLDFLLLCHYRVPRANNPFGLPISFLTSNQRARRREPGYRNHGDNGGEMDQCPAKDIHQMARQRTSISGVTELVLY